MIRRSSFVAALRATERASGPDGTPMTAKVRRSSIAGSRRMSVRSGPGCLRGHLREEGGRGWGEPLCRNLDNQPHPDADPDRGYPNRRPDTEGMETHSKLWSELDPSLGATPKRCPPPPRYRGDGNGFSTPSRAPFLCSGGASEGRGQRIAPTDTPPQHRTAAEPPTNTPACRRCPQP